MKTRIKKWEHFSHGADIGVRGIGPTIVDAFAMGALALTGVVTNPEDVQPIKEVHITCSAPDQEILFADWLNAIIYEMETRGMLFSQFHVEITHSTLHAIIKGEKIDRERHQPAVDVKGATFTELKVRQENNHWIAQCVVDV